MMALFLSLVMRLMKMLTPMQKELTLHSQQQLDLIFLISMVLHRKKLTSMQPFSQNIIVIWDLHLNPVAKVLLALTGLKLIILYGTLKLWLLNVEKFLEQTILLQILQLKKHIQSHHGYPRLISQSIVEYLICSAITSMKAVEVVNGC